MEFMFPGMNLFWDPIHNHLNPSKQGYIDSENGPKKIIKPKNNLYYYFLLLLWRALEKK